MKIKRFLNRTVSLTLCLTNMALLLSSCGLTDGSNTSADATVSDPTINITTIDDTSVEKDFVNEAITEGYVEDAYSIVASSVAYQLSEKGLVTNFGYAQTTENDNYATLGLYYYDESVEFFNDDSMRAVGFIEIVNDTSNYYDPSEEESLIIVNPVDEESEEKELICTFTYDGIKPDHFVYDNKYISYYQLNDMRVVYTVQENNPDNYDLSYGSLYDYDNNEYIYDEDILNGYETHSAIDILSETDYAQLEEDLQKVSDEQFEAGYEVVEYDIVYISPESIQAYLDSNEEDTFFGYSVDSLTESLGLGRSLEYTSEGLVVSEDADRELEDYDWKKFLTKVGIGCGIIIVGAVVTYATQGISIGCTIVYATGVSLTGGLTAGLGTFGIETAIGVIKGKSVEDSMMAASCKGLDAFANGFVVTAAIVSVGVASGTVKPTVCFIAGTPITILSNGKQTTKSIEDIKIDDYVLSYDDNSNKFVYEPVEDVIVKQTNELWYLVIDGEEIITTPEHPFYSEYYGGWVAAKDLIPGDIVLKQGGNATVEISVQRTVEEKLNVYNLTVKDTHTYLVGTNGIVVHNECGKITSLRNKAVREAWAKEKKAVENGTSKYNWSPAQIQELLSTGKIKGYEGHHIFTVKELEGTVNEALIGNPDDIVFLNEAQHLAVHGGYTQNPTDMEVLFDFLPWARDQVDALIALMV